MHPRLNMLVGEPKVSRPFVLIIDYGSPYTDLLTRSVRSLSVFSFCVDATCAITAVNRLQPNAIILSGGSHHRDHVHRRDHGKDDGRSDINNKHINNTNINNNNKNNDNDDDPSCKCNCNCLPDGFLECVESRGIFVLGICNGLRVLFEKLGGEIVRVGGEEEEDKDLEYCGKREIEVVGEKAFSLFGNKSRRGDKQVVWMSSDEVVKVPQGFEVLAMTTTTRRGRGSVAAVMNKKRKFYGLLYHPEVKETPKGMETLKHFLFNVCELPALWKMEVVANEIVNNIDEEVGPKGHVIYVLCESVNSAISAALIHKAIGDRLHCVFVDHGLSLRYKERKDQKRVIEVIGKELNIPVTCIDARQEFHNKLKGVVDPKKKSKIIETVFMERLKGFSSDLKKKFGIKPAHLVGRSLCYDYFSSLPRTTTLTSSPSSPSSQYQSHNISISSIHGSTKINPLALLLKDEAIEIGRVLNVPKSILKREHFDGSGVNVWIWDGLVNNAKLNAFDTFCLRVDETIRRYGGMIHNSMRRSSSSGAGVSAKKKEIKEHINKTPSKTPWMMIGRDISATEKMETTAHNA